MPRSPEHQQQRDELAKSIKADRQQRDALRQESKTLTGRLRKVLGGKDAGASADDAARSADEKLAIGRQNLEAKERVHEWERLDLTLKRAEETIARIPNIAEEESVKMWKAIKEHRSVFEEALRDPSRVGVVLKHFSWFSRNGRGASRDEAETEYLQWAQDNLAFVGGLSEEGEVDAKVGFVRTVVDLWRRLPESRADVTAMVNAHIDAVDVIARTTKEDADFAEVRSLLGMILRKGSKEAKAHAMEIVGELFRRKDKRAQETARLIYDCVGNDVKESDALERTFVAKLAESYDIQPEGLLHAWRLSHDRGAAFEHMQMLCRLEEQSPGAAKRLDEEFGVRAFARYPMEMLLRQATDADQGKPYGIIIMARGDHNGSFHRQVYKWSGLLKDIGDTHAIRVVEAESKDELTAHVLGMYQRYREDGKIAFVHMNGHGSPEEINLGYELLPFQVDERFELHRLPGRLNKRLTKDDLFGVGYREAKEIFEEHPTFVLSSCSTGATSGIGQELSAIYGAEVIAPRDPTSLDHIRAKVVDGRVQFDARFQGGDWVTRRYDRGRLIETPTE
jgi:hypothetical protein